ncbi:MAG: hypothetical protein HY057_05140 [Rhodospirillales bacterium]|nr:hypothetical protein [Rhodospirillales bacterium]
MIVYRYTPRALVGDYMRAGIGFALTAGPATIAPLGSVAQYVLAPLAGLFAVFAARTWIRHAARLEFGPERISLAGPRRASLAWSKLRSVKLSFYSTRGDRGEGWMQLTLRGAGGYDGETIRVDSALDGFADIALRAAVAARNNRLELSAATLANFGALGIEYPPPEQGAT